MNKKQPKVDLVGREVINKLGEVGKILTFDAYIDVDFGYKKATFYYDAFSKGFLQFAAEPTEAEKRAIEENEEEVLDFINCMQNLHVGPVRIEKKKKVK